jgi:hypothetical protein
MSSTRRAALVALTIAAAACTSSDRATEADAGGGDSGPGLADASHGGPDGAPTDGAPGEASAACGVVRSGPVLHVAPGGDDAGDCSAAAPCRTLQRAAERADVPGSVVRVAAGTYRGFQTVHPDVTFEAVGQVVVDGPRGDLVDVIRVFATDGVVIAGFRVKNAPRAGISVLESNDVAVCDNASGPNQRWGIFTAYAPRVAITHNEAFDSVDEHGIYVSNSYVPHDAPRVVGNDVHHNGTSGIQLNGDCMFPGDGTLEDALVARNLVHHNRIKGLSIVAAPGVIIANNLIHDNGTASAGAIHMTNEPGCPDELASSNALVVNNTVVEPFIATFRATDGATGDIVFNNLFIGPTGVIDQVGGNHFAYNLERDHADGLFAADYQLAADSPARDAGAARYLGRDAPSIDLDGTARPQGAGVDLGAREASAGQLAP